MNRLKKMILRLKIDDFVKNDKNQNWQFLAYIMKMQMKIEVFVQESPSFVKFEYKSKAHHNEKKWFK